MTNTPPFGTPSTVEPGPWQSGSMPVLRRRTGRIEVALQMPSAHLPGAWYVNTWIPVVWGGGDGNGMQVTIGLWDAVDVVGGPHGGGLLAKNAPSGDDGVFGGGGNFYAPSTMGDIPVPSVNFGTMRFFGQQAVRLDTATNIWIGPEEAVPGVTGAEWWGVWDQSVVFGPSSTSSPDQIDTKNSQENYGNPFVPGSSADPLMDFDHPVLGVTIQGYSTVLSVGLYPPPFAESNPPVPGIGEVVLYRDLNTPDFTAKSYLLPEFTTCDQLAYQSGPLTSTVVSTPPPPHSEDVDATCFVTYAAYSFVDLSQPQRQPESIIPGPQDVGHLPHD